LTPDWIVELGEVKLCEECYDDSGYDKLHEEKDVIISGGLKDDVEQQNLDNNRGK